MKHPPTPECNRFTHSRIDTTHLQSPTLSPTHLLIHAFTRSLVHSCTQAAKGKAIMFLVEAALGKIHQITQDDSRLVRYVQ